MAMRRKVKEALDRLLAAACQDDGQGRCVADFLLSWWNASTCGNFDSTDLWGKLTPVLAQRTSCPIRTASGRSQFFCLLS